MSKRIGRVYCQRCLADNPVGQESCFRCGTRLMLVVEPSSLRFEDEGLGGGLEEHLLERVSALENHMLRLAERLAQVVELLLRQTRSVQQEHLLLDTLITALSEARAISKQGVESAWRDRLERDTADFEAKERRQLLCARALEQYAGPERELFARLVREGFARVGEGKAAEGVRALERAAALAPASAALNAYLGEHFFREGKPARARDYLARALKADPEDARVRLLLGLTVGDEGEAARAKELLNEAVRRGGPSFAAHCALGRLSAAESDWKTALAEFKRALAARPCPEAHYLLGLVYFNLERYRMARRHLARAVEMDDTYGEAHYLLGLAHARLGERKQAAEALAAARAAGAGGARSARGRQAARGKTPPSLFASGRGARRRLVTGGDARLAAALQADALGVRVER
ncbi:MAG TPA: tetratricopeptide repeat protein [Pyrinomonadaceae bacterium]|nr:tetratricopeptide repeat protein [Pyrinomonadaceae bacterium]